MQNENITNPSRFDLIKQAAERVSENATKTISEHLDTLDALFITEMKKRIPQLKD